MAWLETPRSPANVHATHFTLLTWHVGKYRAPVRLKLNHRGNGRFKAVNHAIVDRARSKKKLAVLSDLHDDEVATEDLVLDAESDSLIQSTPSGTNSDTKLETVQSDSAHCDFHLHSDLGGDAIDLEFVLTRHFSHSSFRSGSAPPSHFSFNYLKTKKNAFSAYFLSNRRF